MKIYHTEKHLKTWLHKIIRELSHDNWKPDYIVGLTRGGLIPATMLSHYLEVPLQTLNVSLRDSELGPESNLWMAEEAFGYVPFDEQETLKSRWDISRRKNILIVDDINDSGATLQWIKDDWQSGCLPNETTAWNSVWNKSVRFAVLVNNQASNFKDVDYVGKEINKLETPAWVVFPWENWWEN
jgi:xanthine phosphoribosyltransferase